MATTINDYLERLEQHKQVLFRIRDGIGYYVVGGKEFPKQEWEATNPVPLYNKNQKDFGEDIDSTRSWMWS